MRKTTRAVVFVLVFQFLGSSALAQGIPAIPSTPPPPAAPSASTTPFSRFVRSLGRDLFGLPSATNILTLGIGGAAALAAKPSDLRLTQRAHASARMDEVFEFGSVAGSGWVQFGGAAATLVAGQAFDNPKIRSLGADLLRAQTINAALTQGLKVLVRRMRPDGSAFSFPSGHASATFATATVLTRHFGWKVGVPAYAVATYVATSRLQENRHYASDVIFGAAVGIVAGRSVTIGHGASRVVLSPMLAPGVAGIAFTRPAR